MPPLIFHYVSTLKTIITTEPPLQSCLGISRQVDPSDPQVAQLNNNLVMKVLNLQNGDARPDL